MLGTCTIKYGYLISIFKIEEIENGIVNAEGDALFTVSFKALCFRPFANEILEGEVTGVELVGMEIKVGSVQIFISHTQIPKQLVYNQIERVFENSEEKTLKIGKGNMVRFRVLNVSLKGSEEIESLSGIGTLKGDYLGLVN